MLKQEADVVQEAGRRCGYIFNRVSRLDYMERCPEKCNIELCGMEDLVKCLVTIRQLLTRGKNKKEIK